MPDRESPNPVSMPLSEMVRQLYATGLPVCIEAALFIETLFPAETGHRLHVDINTNRAERAGYKANLSPNEAVILHSLYQRGGRPMRTDELSSAVHGKHMKASPNSIRQSIPMLRRKVRKLGVRIVNEFGHGYRLEMAPVRPVAEDKE